MKIENDNPNPLTGPADSLNPTNAVGPSGGAAKGAAPANRGDQLTLSPEAQLLKAAADAAAGDTAVRVDLVARMRELLAQGRVGDDARRLAEALIDDVLKNSDGR